MSVVPSAGHLIGHAGGSTPVDMALAAMRAPGGLPAGLLEDHYAWWIAGIALGAVLWYVGRRRPDVRVTRAGQILLALTVMWVGLSKMFDTAGERLYHAHEALIAAAEKNDVDAMLTWFGPQFSATDIGISLDTSDDEVRKKLGDLLKEVTISNVRIRRYEQSFDGNGAAATQFTAFVESNQWMGLTTWRIGWKDVGGQDWRMFDATMLEPKFTPRMMK